MLKANLNNLRSKIKFQEIGLTSRSCIAGCGCSSGCSCGSSGCGSYGCGCSGCKCLENGVSIDTLDKIYS